MKKNVIRIISTSFIAAMAMNITAFAGQWQPAEGGNWVYVNDNGTRPFGRWRWIDGNQDGIAECYYFEKRFDSVGGCGLYSMVANMTGIDSLGHWDDTGWIIDFEGYEVNSEGQWIVDGVVQTRPANEIDLNADEWIDTFRSTFLDYFLAGFSSSFVNGIETEWNEHDSGVFNINLPSDLAERLLVLESDSESVEAEKHEIFNDACEDVAYGDYASEGSVGVGDWEWSYNYDDSAQILTFTYRFYRFD